MVLDVPRDRNGQFDPLLIPKYARRFPGFDDKLVALYARGMSTRDIQAHIGKIYGIGVSPSLVSTVTEAVMDVPPRLQRDLEVKPEVARVWNENLQVYGARKVWRQPNREDDTVARCTVRRLMGELGLKGTVRGRAPKTTFANVADVSPADRLNRQFQSPRPNALWVSDLTYVATWQGFVHVAFVIDAYARRIVGWRVSSSLRTDIALDALEQALYDRRLNATVA